MQVQQRTQAEPVSSCEDSRPFLLRSRLEWGRHELSRFLLIIAYCGGCAGVTVIVHRCQVSPSFHSCRASATSMCMPACQCLETSLGAPSLLHGIVYLATALCRSNFYFFDSAPHSSSTPIVSCYVPGRQTPRRNAPGTGNRSSRT